MPTPDRFVNGVRLAPDAPTALASGDLIRVGPWTFRVIIDGHASSHLASGDDTSIASVEVLQ